MSNQKAVILDNVKPQTSQSVGKVKHNTVSNPHAKSHAIADEIASRHDVHSFQQNTGSVKHNTSSVGTEIGTVQDGRDEHEAVEKH